MARPRLSKEERRKRRLRWRRKLTGLVFLTLALIGVASIIALVVNTISTMLDDTDERIAYQQLYAPLVSLDPVAFSSIEKANQDVLRQAAIIAALYNENPERFGRDSFNRILLPRADVDKWAAKLYGPKFRLEHKTFGQSGFVGEDGVDQSGFIYQPDTQQYAVPPLSIAGGFSPVVKIIERSGNTKVLFVDYMQTSSATALLPPDTETLAKQMEYVLIRDGDEYFLYAIRESDSHNS